MTTDELGDFILPWAREQKPDLYQKTLAVAGKPTTLRNYLLRLVEIRYSEDASFRPEVPLSVLEETAVQQRVRIRSSGVELTVAGKRAERRVWGFGELLAILESPDPAESLATLLSAKTVLDLELIGVG